LILCPSAHKRIAGEISSIYGHLYLEAGNITECFVAGKIAGQNAAAEQRWE
jgi:succinate dehydrogenase/fumarate reductase flavoprotein subunit